MATKKTTKKVDPQSRDSAGRFRKGVSGNPGGQKALTPDLREAFRGKTMDAFNALVKIINNPNSKDTDIIKASEIILDRGWGKATQMVDMNASVDATPLKIAFEGELGDWAK